MLGKLDPFSFVPQSAKQLQRNHQDQALEIYSDKWCYFLEFSFQTKKILHEQRSHSLHTKDATQITAKDVKCFSLRISPSSACYSAAQNVSKIFALESFHLDLNRLFIIIKTPDLITNPRSHSILINMTQKGLWKLA